MDDLAAVEDDRVVRDRQDLLRVLLDDDRREAFVQDQPLDRAQQFLDDDRRESLERLVEEEQLRVEDERARDREHLLLAARQLVAEVGLSLLEAREHLVDAARRPRAGRATAVRFSSTLSDLKMFL